MIQIKKAKSTEDLEGILSLQKGNLKGSLTPTEVNQEGFVTVDHDLETLELMQSYEPQIIAVQDQKVVGYALVMVRQLKDLIPVLKPMFKKLDQISYKQKRIADSSYYIMGQVCIDKGYRGQGLFAKLYEMHKEVFASKYEYCITEVSDSNARSMRAHEKVGFEIMHSYSDADDWNILLLDLNKK